MTPKLNRPALCGWLLVTLASHSTFAQTSTTASPIKALKLASDDWCPFVCVANGMITGGFLVELTTEAMNLSGYQVESVLVPFTRAMNETVNGNIQGVYSPPDDSRLLISAPLSYTHSCFYTRVNQNWTFRGLSSLQSVTVGVIADYNYDDGNFDAYVVRNRTNKALVDMAYGEFAGESNLKKLLASRFGVMIEDEAVMGMMARKLNAENKIRVAGCLDKPLAITIGFTKADPHSEDWTKALAAGVQQLEASGKLQALRVRYQIPGNNLPEKFK